MLIEGTDVLRLDAIVSGVHDVCVRWSVDHRQFQTDYLYETVDLLALEAELGLETFRSVVFHIALFEINKGASLRPARVDLGEWAPYLTQPLADLWTAVTRYAWAQWRYHHGEPGYHGPVLTPNPNAQPAQPLDRALASTRYLTFCGGGKDALLAMHLLERCGVPYDTFTYASSAYGPPAPQFALIDTLLAHLGPVVQHRQSVIDTFVATPIAELERDLGVSLLTTAETPSSIFASLPLVLAHRFTGVVVAHERSANRGNLVWEVTGEDVNHQWGKSFAAEQLLNSYIRTHLIADFTYFSLLAPIHDALIFAMLGDALAAALPDTHSCNVAKPWCMRCAKCAYVWINFKAWLPWDVVDPIFGGANLLDFPENQQHYRQLLGLEAHTPFECIGQIEESRLAFALARQLGLTGAAMQTFEAGVGMHHEWEALAEPLLTVHGGANGIPEPLASAVVAAMTTASQAARARVRTLLGARDQALVPGG